MVKAKDFWDYLCNSLGYRFYSGVPCVQLNTLYNKMGPGFLHYVPAVNEQIAVSLSSGAFLAGVKSAVLMSIDNIDRLDLDFNRKNLVPILFIVGSVDNKLPKDVYGIQLSDDFVACLDEITEYIEDKKSMGVLLIGEDVLQ